VASMCGESKLASGYRTVPLLYLVSHSTEVVFVGKGHHILRYPWLPWWLVAIATAISVAAWWRSARKARDSQSILELEEGPCLVVGPILLFLSIATLPGALGPCKGSTIQAIWPRRS